MSRSAASPTSGAAAAAPAVASASAGGGLVRPAVAVAVAPGDRRRRDGLDRRLRRREERLVAVQHQERQGDGEENAPFHSATSGSTTSRSCRAPDRARSTRADGSARAGAPPATTPLTAPWTRHGLARVVRAGRHEPAGSGKQRRQQHLVEREQRQRGSLRQSCAARRRVSGHCGPDAASRGGWPTASRARGWRSRHRRTRAGESTTMSIAGPDPGVTFCGTPLESSV